MQLDCLSLRQKAVALFSDVSSEKKLEKLKKLSDAELSALYAIADSLVNAIYSIEFNLNLSPRASAVKALLDAFRRNTPGPTTEEKFLSTVFYELVPVLYYAEKDREVQPDKTVNDELFHTVTIDFMNSVVKSLPPNREVELKTYELKRYPKTRLDLDDEDQVAIADGSETFVITKACVFKVNRLNVLCGFFSENGGWRSEKYVATDVLDRIVQKYNLVRRRIDS